MIGRTVSQYEILERVGAGGMGEVYRARDTRLGRDVALKFLRPGSESDRKLSARFLAEAKTVSSLNHSNILTLHEIGEFERGQFLVTEFVEGRTVRDILAEGPVSVSEAVRIATQVTRRAC